MQTLEIETPQAAEPMNTRTECTRCGVTLFPAFMFPDSVCGSCKGLSITATYSPEDNKIRLTASERLSPELYGRVKAAGFGWAPVQKIFVAPMWTPGREDLALELAGEIEDEGISLEERQAQRAERFQGYRENRIGDAYAAKDRIGQVSGVIGHHRRDQAERQAEKQTRQINKAVQFWDTAEYWRDRAAGALRHGRYKEVPAVRFRRIKGLQSDLRRVEKNLEVYRIFLGMWTNAERELTQGRALAISGRQQISSYRCYPVAQFPRTKECASVYEGEMSLYSALSDEIITPDQARDIAVAAHECAIAEVQRWENHYRNRLSFERAMLGENPTETYANIEPGGRVLVRTEWLAVIRVNRKQGRIMSVTTNARYVSVIGIEKISGYEPPAEGMAEKVRAITKNPPLVNWRAPGCREITSAEWKQFSRNSDSHYVETFKATETSGAYRQRTLSVGFCKPRVTVFLTDAKETHPPKPPAAPEPKPEPIARVFDATEEAMEAAHARRVRRDREARALEAAPFEELRSTAKQGIVVVSAPQLFPTPANIAALAVELADPRPGDRILEPEAGTGRLLDAVEGYIADEVSTTAVEVNYTLAEDLRRRYPAVEVLQADFLECNPEERTPNGTFFTDLATSLSIGTFDVILMNPPFANAQDIQHIQHARRFLRPGGRLVAICADGPRQNDALRGLADHWEPLPAGTFDGTGVRSVLLRIRG